MKVLITGGKGFIASCLHKYLKDKYIAYAPSKQELDLCDSDAVYHYLHRHFFDVVVHVANYDGMTRYTTKDRNLILDRNLRMCFNLTNNRHLFDRLIHIGSGAEYNFEELNKFDIDTPRESHDNLCLPNDPYGLSKYAISQYLRLSDFAMVLRLFGIYGPAENWKIKFISNACCRHLCGLPITIKQDRYMNYVYIYDLCKIIDIFLSHNCKHNIYNICQDNTISLTKIVKYIQERSTSPAKVNILKDGFGLGYNGSNKQLREELPDFVFTNYKSGIEKLYEYYRQNSFMYDPEFLKHQQIRSEQ